MIKLPPFLCNTTSWRCMEKGSVASLLSGRVSSFLLHRQSLGLRTGMDVLENRNISVSSVWTWCEGNVCVSGLGVVQKKNVFVLDMVRGECVFVCGLARCRRGLSLCLRSWHSVTGVSLCLRPGHRVTVPLCLMSERSAEKECLYVSV
jgi:hypothetical protein